MGSTVLIFVGLFTVHVRISSLKKGILSDNHRFLAQMFLNIFIASFNIGSEDVSVFHSFCQVKGCF